MNIAPYGTWSSTLTAALVSSASVRLGQAWLTATAVYWLEGRPSAGGRTILVRQNGNGERQDCLPPEFNVRTRVHEYGGGAYLVDGETIYFINFSDQRLYLQRGNQPPEALTAEGNRRYADGVVHGNRTLWVCEEHLPTGEVNNFLVALDDAGQATTLAQGHDFYSNPRPSPDGKYLAWLTWDHPNLPWDGTELWLAPFLADGRLGEAERIAGGPTESIFQPEWSADGILHFVSDRTGWWNLYRYEFGATTALYPLPAEFGEPQWVFGQRTYGFSSEGILASYRQGGISHLVHQVGATWQEIPTPYTEITGLQVLGTQAIFYGASPTEPLTLVQLDLISQQCKPLCTAHDLELDRALLSRGEALEFPTAGDLTAHGFFYRPQNPYFQAPTGTKPPLLVLSHGGPTGSTSNSLSLGIQFWTSRGFAVLDVNYGGSTGYGRAYRQRLVGNWGIVDVEDCVRGVEYLVAQGWVAPDQVAIRGGSAGGYTTLCALTFTDTFQAGASYYGVSDLELLAQDTHKFESRYLDHLVGPYPEAQARYRERSPIHQAARLSCPVVFFHGLEDRVVPPNQAERMVEVLQAKGVTVQYVPFPGEQHGFRKSENIQRALEVELAFYGAVFGFSPV